MLNEEKNTSVIWYTRCHYIIKMMFFMVSFIITACPKRNLLITRQCKSIYVSARLKHTFVEGHLMLFLSICVKDALELRI